MSPRLSYDEIAKQNVAKLLDYAVKHLYLEDYDVIYVQNQLLDALKLTEPTDSDKIGDYDFTRLWTRFRATPYAKNH